MQEVQNNFTHPGTYVILTGAHKHPLEPAAVTHKGSIFAPLAWFKKKFDVTSAQFADVFGSPVANNKVTVVADRNEGTITLIIDEHSPYATKIIGQLSKFKELETSGINTGNGLTLDELKKFIKRYSYYFHVSESKDLLLLLQEYKVRIDKTVSDQDDKLGNTNKGVETKTDLNGLQDKLKFSLKMPIYEDTPATVFEVNIYVDASTHNIKYMLESVELLRLEPEVKENALTAALGDMRDHFAIIKK